MMRSLSPRNPRVGHAKCRGRFTAVCPLRAHWNQDVGERERVDEGQWPPPPPPPPGFTEESVRKVL